MRHARLLGLALMATFAFGVMAAATASAAEPGILYLPGQEGPVTLKGASTTAEPIFSVGTDKLPCKNFEFSGELGKGEGTHSKLGSLAVDYTGCEESNKKASCRSENAAGEKDPAGTILQVAAGTDLHTVAIENAEKVLGPGLLVGFLEVEAGGKKQDLTINCGLVKEFLLGATFLEAKGAKEGTDITIVEVLPSNTAKCKEDTLCTTELEKWEAKEGTKNCPLAGRLAETEFCGSFTTAKPVKVEFSKDVLFDF